MKIKNLPKFFFFIILVAVFVVLSFGYIYRRYRDKGNILGYTLIKLNTTNINPTKFQPYKKIPTQIISEYILEFTPTPVPSITPTPVPKLEIKIVNFPEKVKLNENTAFTWQVLGPPGSTNYTAIVGSKDSGAENLDENTKLENTAYRVLTTEFITGSFNIPLNFVGNTTLPEYGKWYIRALVVVDGKNIWSDQYTVTVE